MRYQFQMGPYFVFTFKRNLIWLRITAKMIFFLFYIVCLLLNTQPGSTKQKLQIIMATLAYYYIKFYSKMYYEYKCFNDIRPEKFLNTKGRIS